MIHIEVHPSEPVVQKLRNLTRDLSPNFSILTLDTDSPTPYIAVTGTGDPYTELTRLSHYGHYGEVAR